MSNLDQESCVGGGGGGEESESETSNEVVPSNATDNPNYDDRLSQDAKLIENVLPAILWTEKSFGEQLADNPDTFEHLVNSSPYFREVLKEKRVLFLSKKVFKIFHAWNFPPNVRRFDFLQTYLYEFLKWRLVCSSWCSSLDHLLKEELINGECHLRSKFSAHFGFENNTKLVKFFDHFESSHLPSDTNGRSPFIGGYLNVDSDDLRIYLSLFRCYGHHISHLSIGSSILLTSNLTPEQSYLNMGQLLMLAPNLKSLAIFYSCADDTANPTEAYISAHPAPTIASLEKLEIRAPPPIITTFLLQNDHILKLKICGRGKEGYGLNVRMPKLEEFEILTHSSVSRHVVEFVPVVMSGWPLKKLRLRDRDMIRWRERFQMISDTWGSTLEELHLGFPAGFCNAEMKSTIMSDSLNSRLHLPKVKVLELMIQTTICSLNFLLEMKMLESITIISISTRDLVGDDKVHKKIILEAEEKQLVQWIGYEDRLEESNIWNLFGKLKKIKCNNVPYFRENGVVRCARRRQE